FQSVTSRRVSFLPLVEGNAHLHLGVADGSGGRLEEEWNLYGALVQESMSGAGNINEVGELVFPVLRPQKGRFFLEEQRSNKVSIMDGRVIYRPEPEIRGAEGFKYRISDLVSVQVLLEPENGGLSVSSESGSDEPGFFATDENEVGRPGRKRPPKSDFLDGAFGDSPS
ncbi:MAG: hypothetical protein AAF191_14420, partial [Verrucomicrobiota bacterium]